MDLKEKKKELRREIKNKFKNLSENELSVRSEKILEKLNNLNSWKNAEIVLGFVSMKDEIATYPILKSVLDNGKILAVPKVVGTELEFHIIHDFDKELKPGAFEILEPEVHTPILNVIKLPEKNNLILVPGLAFDGDNYRLGRGKGFYDRFFDILPGYVTKIGICCDFQIVSSVPRESHDWKLDMVISDN